jgi:glucosamine--fructose-6-phosphate aminotransferase (isomerizing)
MCGIVGIIARERFSVKDDLIRSLQRLEYRGYDSCGFATFEGLIKKNTGYIENLANGMGHIETTLGISHTRWATHGGITQTNAHPHANGGKTIFAVHNGIIENFEAFKEKLQKEGYRFVSETDTEIIPHYFDSHLKLGKDIREIIKDFIDEVEGTFAVLLFVKGDHHLYAFKKDSPLVLGISSDRFVLASDIYAFSDHSNRAIFFEDHEFAMIGNQGYEFFDKNGKPVEKQVMEFTWSRKEETKEEFEHYMLKEIKEQPLVSERLIQSFDTIQKDQLDKLAEMVKTARRVVFLACGTSYHASLVGCFLLNHLGMEAHTVIASEFESFMLVDEDTLVIAISQSGETMDVVTVLKHIRETGARFAAIVNVPYSTVQRLSDLSIEILAGQEICVAATKSFTNQLIILFALAQKLGFKDIDLGSLPGKIQETIDLNEEYIIKLAEGLYEKEHIFVLGRGISYPQAREIALKLKEIPYIHAEGMMAGELKHGTIALIEDGTPVISLVPNNNPDMSSSTKEVEARGARTIIISNTNGELKIPPCCDAEFAIYSGIVGHLLSYYIAKLRGCSIDKPRNLAKSVTVK